MCGRYSALTEDEIIEVRKIIQEWSMRIIKDDFDDYDAVPGEIRPTNHAPVISMKNDSILFESLKWGFKKWDGKGVIINARSETLKTTRTFTPLLEVGRCVVPAGEYFEWEQLAKGKRKHFIKDAEGNLLFMAGLYRDGADGREFVIITKDAVGDVERIHDRMPVILKAEQIEIWLNGTLTPEDIVNMDFNVSVTPCDDDSGNEGEKINATQLRLDL